MEQSWNDHIRGDHDVMDIETTQWTTVGSKRKTTRSKSPPTSLRTSNATCPSITGISDIVEGGDSLDHAGPTKIQDTTTNHPNPAPVQQTNYRGGIELSYGKANTFTMSSNNTTTSSEKSTDKQSAFQPLMNVPTNDGTYRITFRWTPQGDFKNYNEHSPIWLTEAHSLMADLFTDEDCSLYRWESTDLTQSHVMSELSPGELREFLSPHITFIPSTSQIIFGARICFAAKTPGQWKNKERTRMAMKDNQVSVQISNSSTKSGKIVTAGYILLKAARTTHRTRFLQCLRLKLPSEAPFFDILQFQRTPMEQKIPHLVVQCGENHVSPLSKALSEILTGHNSSLYLPRLALSKLSPAQISTYFEMQDKYSKSLKSLALFPTLTNLDKIRKEYYEDGTTVERSTREWASTLFEGQTDISARCEVVNGGYDQKAYLLVPNQHFQVAQEHLRQYRLRINPIGRREARFRDSLPGLPTVIHIDTSTQNNLDFLAQLSASEVWERAPQAVRQASSHNNSVGDRTNHRQDPEHPQQDTIQPEHKINSMKGRTSTRLYSLGEGEETQHHGNQYTEPIGHDDQTTSTKSATQSLVTPSLLSNATSKRLLELEALFRNQQQAIDNNTILGKQMDSALQQTITTLKENSVKLVLTMERQQDTHVQLVELSTRVSRFTEVMDRMASQIEALTTLTIRNQSQQLPSENAQDGNRRRSIAELSIQVESETGPGRRFHSNNTIHFGQEDQPNASANPTTIKTDRVTSPTKKKSRQHQDLSSHMLHAELEEMSLGSNARDQIITTESMDRPLQIYPPMDNLQDGMSLLDDDSDNFSSATADDLPNLDTQYNLPRDPEGGESR